MPANIILLNMITTCLIDLRFCLLTTQGQREIWCTRLVIFTAVKIPVEVFCVVMPCSVVVGYQRFRGPCCLLPQNYVASQHNSSTWIYLVFSKFVFRPTSLAIFKNLIASSMTTNWYDVFNLNNFFTFINFDRSYSEMKAVKGSTPFSSLVQHRSIFSFS
jgi:hypothetical protein